MRKFDHQPQPVTRDMLRRAARRVLRNLDLSSYDIGRELRMDNAGIWRVIQGTRNAGKGMIAAINMRWPQEFAKALLEIMDATEAYPRDPPGHAPLSDRRPLASDSGSE